MRSLIGNPEVLFAVNHSGGKDSQAMLAHLLQFVPRSQIVVVHATLGEMEWPGALELARENAEQFGLPFIVAAAAKSLLGMVERRFISRPSVPSWPSATTRQCTSDLKRGPIQRELRRYAKANGFKAIVNCLGLRAAESPGRAKKIPFRKNSAVSNGVLTWFEWLPIHDWSVNQVFESILCAGMVPHYAYSLGNERLSCMFCIMASKNDLKNAAKANPDLLARYIRMEGLTGYTMHQSRISLVQLVD